MGAYEAKSHFSELLERVQNGEEITITRHGAPVARLIPVRATSTPEQRDIALRRWKEISKDIRLDGLKLRDLIDEGRP